jgi:ferrochelatase
MNHPGVLLVNLGSPDAPSVPAVRRYLRDAPYLIRFLVVHGLILPFRSRQSAEAYHKIWTPAGSPLIALSQEVRQALAAQVSVPLALAMRYQRPTIESAVEALRDRGVREMLVIPLFPHYAMSSYETAVERVKSVVRRRAPALRVAVQPPYYERADYIAALVASAADSLQAGYDHLLFSFHGVPERHLRKSDPTGRHCLQTPDCCAQDGPARATCYRAQCLRTVAAFVREAAVRRYSVAFQSRLGRDPWLTPYTDQELVRLARAGVRRLRVICPAFVSDCLETLEEIGMRGRETFLEAGGEDYALIPCLNSHPLWIDTLQHMVTEFATVTPPAPPPASSRTPE